jgi:formylmethanofuran dehydrogenase subunit E
MTQTKYENNFDNKFDTMCAECGNEFLNSQVVEEENLPLCYYCNRKKIQNY